MKGGPPKNLGPFGKVWPLREKIGISLAASENSREKRTLGDEKTPEKHRSCNQTDYYQFERRDNKNTRAKLTKLTKLTGLIAGKGLK
jgi:hypothetical protein